MEMIVDLFAGGGGASQGIKQALGRDPDVGINHDRIAITMHAANHPGTYHYCQDIWQVSPRMATGGRPVGLLWASPDCKHFSKAKGAAPKRDVEIRSLAWVVVKWAREIGPRVIILENVEEFTSWGPIDSEGHIIPERRGEIFGKFVACLRRLGYAVQWRELRACDYGAPTIRKRLFLIARCDGQPIVWPEPTHGPGLQPYRTAAEIIDWSIPCPSIFDRSRPLADNTLRRIAEGLRRYVVEAAEPFIVPLTHQGSPRRVNGIMDPLPTITAAHRGELALVTPFVTEHANGSGQRNFLADEPLRTQCANVKGGHFALMAAFLSKFYGTNVGQELTKPMPTITSGGQHIAEVRAFLVKYYGTGCGQVLEDPAATVTTKDRLGLVTVMVQGEPYVITDIGMRMLTPRELFRAQGFPDDYRIDIDVDGKPITKTAQVRCCGNSVCPPVAEAMVRANVEVMPSIDEMVDMSDFQLELTAA